MTQKVNQINSVLGSNVATEETILEKNKRRYAVLKKYNLPLGKYAIGGSGPLGIRGIREINDIDIVVSNDLRDTLIQKYGMVDDGIVKKIAFPDDDIEAFWEGSFYIQTKEHNTPTVSDIISRAEIIDELPFQSLADVIYFKRIMNRLKDLEDIKLIEQWYITGSDRKN